MAEILFWDSCIIIDAIQKKPSNFAYLSDMIKRAQAGELFIVISSVTIAEVIYLRELTAAGITAAQQADLISGWLNQDYIVQRNADIGVCRYAAELGRDVGKANKTITPLDSIILATALKVNASALITLDDGKVSNNVGLLKLNEQYGDPRLKILTPEQYHAKDADISGQIVLSLQHAEENQPQQELLRTPQPLLTIKAEASESTPNEANKADNAEQKPAPDPKS